MSFVNLNIFGTSFEVTTRYEDLQPVGMGAFCLVCSAKDQLTGCSVAIRKITKPFNTPVLSKRTYHDLKLLKRIQHENTISLSDVFISPLEDLLALFDHSNGILSHPQLFELFRHRIVGHRSPPSPHITFFGKTMYPVFPISDTRKSMQLLLSFVTE